jgi:phosphatidylserine synthase
MTAVVSPLRAFHASNLLTYGSLVAGVGAIAFGAGGNRSAAGALIAMSVVADTFDGRFAGLFRRTAMQRLVGVQLDSLSDAIAFGIAPAVCMAALRADWWPTAPGGIFWLAVFVYAACAITRLAFYNVAHEETEGFIGLPVPVAALILATALAFAPGVVTSTRHRPRRLHLLATAPHRRICRAGSLDPACRGQLADLTRRKPRLEEPLLISALPRLPTR